MLARTIDDLTPAWFSSALGSTVTDVSCAIFGEGVGMLSVMAGAQRARDDCRIARLRQ